MSDVEVPYENLRVCGSCAIYIKITGEEKIKNLRGQSVTWFSHVHTEFTNDDSKMGILKKPVSQE